MVSTKYIWLTRPAEDSAAMADMLNARGVATIISPVMKLELLSAPTITKNPSAILLTSRHAAFAIHDDWKNIPTYCVGDATAQVARDSGCSEVIAGSGEVLALLPVLSKTFMRDDTILYLSGEEVRFDLPMLAASHQLTITREIVYRTVAETMLTDELKTVLANKNLAGVSCFSPHTARIISDLLTAANLTQNAADLDFYALSLAVAEAAAGAPWKSIHACHLPTLPAMVDLIVSSANG
jgi:uroporphyrinogen-III synthase